MPAYKEGWKFAAIEGVGPALPARSIELPVLRRFPASACQISSSPDFFVIASWTCLPTALR